ncbi:hypothetical protein BD311DRAFT_730447 [Dichomitus squalens]|uniref:C2H2-type domain-containing protein n=2 Tax=Dichomitus squalens TaxID=114155 RepID=A0A4V6MVT5_9APHY|nr:hypothetical protein BD311DRAFT_730447 [Dichomitus squalens]
MLASNDPDISSAPHPHPSHSSFDSEFPPSSLPSPLSLPAKKKHVCHTCQRAFTTSGHLARHTRIHTGERNHKCPFPGCETRCSRQDNLQQHYRIHLSPGSRRNSGSATRAAMNRASANDRSRSRKRSKQDSPNSPSPPPPVPSPPLDPPPLAQAYPTLPAGVPEPPDTPPPLAQAYPTLPPPTAPAYPQQSAAAASRSSRSTPEAAYYSPVSYAHPSLASAPSSSHASYHEDVPYPPSSQGSRASSFGRPGDDPRWPYHHQGEQSYSASESDRYSPISPVANSNGHYPEPASPVESLNSHHRAHGQAPGHVQMSPHDSVSYFNHYHQSAPRQSQPNTAGPTSASPVPLSISQQPTSSHRHSIAHISNPIRQHSPTSTNSASPVVSTPPTPGYGYLPTGMGAYAESPPGSLSPATPAPPQQHPSAVVPVYNSYESSSLASAGYSQPPPGQVQHVQSQHPQQQQQMYDRTLPALTATHAREPQSTLPHTHFNYAPQTTYQSGSMGSSNRYNSERPILAPIVDSRVLRGDASAAAGLRYASASSPQPQPLAQPQAQQQPPMQSLANAGRGSGSTAHHAFSYPPHSQQIQTPVPQPSHAHATASETSYTSAAAYGHTSSSTVPTPVSSHGHGHSHSPSHSNGHLTHPTHPSSASSSTQEYYYHAVPTHPHGQREPSPEGAEVDPAADQYLELHQPQPQRAALPAHASHQYIQPQPAAPGAMMAGHTHHGHGHGHHHVPHHPVWRSVDDYRGRLVQ